MVGYEGEKMSKSKGNLVLVSTLRREGADPAAIRAALLSRHYRSDWEWTEDSLSRAQERLDRWRAALDHEQEDDAAGLLVSLHAALSDDLDAPSALRELDEWAARALQRPAAARRDQQGLGASCVVDALLGIRLTDA